MKLTDSFDDAIYFNGREIKVRVFFDVVLRAIDLVNDEIFSNAEKWEMLADMFAEDPADIEGLRLYEKTAFVQAVLDNFVSEDKADGQEGSSESETQEKYYDLNQDADYIYASFLFDYNMDLIEQQGKLHWKKFKALLNGLSDKTKFREVVGIRMRKLPKNAEERKELQKLKRLYALNKGPQTEKDIQKTVQAMDSKADAVASALKRKRGVK